MRADSFSHPDGSARACPTPLAQPLALLEDVVVQRLGLEVLPSRSAQTLERLAALATNAGFSHVSDYLLFVRRLPLEAPSMQSLIRALTSRESYFFRDETAQRSLRELVVPEVIARCSATRRLRVWNAGCAEGEEIYSLSMLLQDLLPDYDAWDIQLVATDIDAMALVHAERASYKRWALSATDRDRWSCFDVDPLTGSAVLRARYRRNVTFRLHNLADPEAELPSPAHFDLVVCRNVLAQLASTGRDAAWSALRTALAPGGVWVSGSNDPEPAVGWATRSLPGLVCYVPNAEGAEEVDSRRRAVESRRFSLPPASDEPLSRPDSSRRHPRLLQRARELLDDGAYEDALTLLREVIVEDPLVPDSYRLLASVQESLGHPELAVRELRRAIRLEPNDAQAQLRLGFLLQQQGAREGALRAFLAAVSLTDSPADLEPESATVRELATSQVVQLLGSTTPDANRSARSS